jgi:nicotinate-nucleotide adenylyltransferase
MMENQANKAGEPLAFFGGTFDPVHYGHLRCAEQARQLLKLETLYLLPAGDPPHRSTPYTTARQRLEMLRLALADFPSLAIDEREIHRNGPSYMVDTLVELQTQFRHRPLLLLIGQDAVNLLHTWHEWQRLFELTHIVTFPRPGAEPDYRPDIARQMARRTCPDLDSLLKMEVGGVLHLDLERIDISATAIQSMMRLGRSPRSMLPDAVLEYINENELYTRA